MARWQDTIWADNFYDAPDVSDGHEDTSWDALNHKVVAEAETHDKIAGSRTSPRRPWRKLRLNTEIGRRIVAGFEHDPIRAQLERAETQRQYAMENFKAFAKFQNEFGQLYHHLAPDKETERTMMYADFAQNVNPIEVLFDGLLAQEVGDDVPVENVPAAVINLIHEHLREMLGPELYQQYYGENDGQQRPSVDDRVRAADKLTEELIADKKETTQNIEGT